MNKHTLAMLHRLHDLGISDTDALALRRISMTLHRWHELECGDGDSYGSWRITRGFKVNAHCSKGDEPLPLKKQATFKHDDDGKPYMERHYYYPYGNSPNTVTYSPLPDRETGAKKRLAKILANYPHLTSYIQTDPRGCALYILKSSDVTDTPVDQIYNSRGIAVYK